MATLRAAELEVLFTADTNQVQKAEKDVQTIGRKVESKPITQKIDADAKGALAGMDRVEQAARKLVSQDTALKLDADVTRAEKSLDRAKQRLADLEVRALGGLDVTADVRRAEAALSKIERNLDGLRTAKNQIEIDASTVKAENELDKLGPKAKAAGGKAGAEAGKSLEDTLVSALVAIPIAGGIVLAGVAIGKAVSGAIQDGLQVEVGRDRLQALTGISEADALSLGRVAGEAYANVFGDSIEANMDTTRLALQFDLIDADASTRSAQKVVEGLSGIADVLGEDVQPIAAAVTKMLNAGLAKSAENAFDIIATGAREGVNLGEDLLDTLGEYASTFSALGLSGDQALGLLNQGLEAGAPNADFFADSIRELGIRLRAGDEATAGFLSQAGLVPDALAKAFVEGGPAAAAGLDSVFDALNAIENPVERNRVAVGILGTQYEDLQLDLSKLDLTTAVDQLNGVTGSAQRMFDTLADNDATKMEQASRNIEVAADGIKGALAAAFSEPLGDFAEFVSQNRGPILEFFSDLANTAFDFGENMVIAAADGTESLGGFVAGPLAEAVDGLATLFGFFGRDTTELEALADDMRNFDETASDAADTMREKLLPPIGEARDGFNEFADGAIAMAYLNDASNRLAGSLGQVGVDGEGAKLALDGIDLANLRASDSGKVLSDQVRDSVIALQDEQVAASAAGESQEALAERYRLGTDALVGQLTQMGLTKEEAQALIDTVLKTPTSATTAYGSNVLAEQGKVQSLADRIVTLPDGSVVILADTSPARAEMARFFRSWNGTTVAVNVNAKENHNYAQGAVVDFMASGGLRGFTPMQPIAQVVPQETWRVVGDRSDVPESYIPLDGSPRSMAILLETMRRMGVTAMAEGGIAAQSGRTSGGGPARSTAGASRTPEIVQLVLKDGRVLAEVLRDHDRSLE